MSTVGVLKLVNVSGGHGGAVQVAGTTVNTYCGRMREASVWAGCTAQRKCVTATPPAPQPTFVNALVGTGRAVAVPAVGPVACAFVSSRPAGMVRMREFWPGVRAPLARMPTTLTLYCRQGRREMHELHAPC